MQRIPFLTLLFVFLARPALAEIASVWALDDGTKVKATATDHPLEAGNGVFDPSGPQITLFGARNEIVAFQVILEGGAAATGNVRVLLDSIGPIENSGLTGEMDSYFIGRRIEIFLQQTSPPAPTISPGGRAPTPSRPGWTAGSPTP
jgi:hypothetical protein